jgi:phage gp46-like protein
MSKDRGEKKKEALAKAEAFAREALSAVSKGPVSETKVRAVAKKVSKTMLEVLEHP